MVINKMSVGPLGTNSFVYEKNGLVIVIDPGGTPDETKKLFSKRSTPVTHILLTHGHIDHILGVGKLKELFPDAALLIDKDDLQLYEKAEIQASMFGLPFAKLPTPSFFEGDEVAGLSILKTPGHSPGSVSFYDDSKGVLFAGDTLFRYSVGRTDLWGGSWGELVKSIKNQLFILPPETLVYTGHGPDTTIADEIANNPFLD
jgi:hydroxyacylglutathione hydrolase